MTEPEKDALSGSDLQAAIRTAGMLRRAWQSLVRLVAGTWKQLATVGIVAGVSGASPQGIDLSWISQLSPDQRAVLLGFMAMAFALHAMWRRLTDLETWCRTELVQALADSTRAACRATAATHDSAMRLAVHCDRTDDRLRRIESACNMPAEIPTGTTSALDRKTADLAPQSQAFPAEGDPRHAETLTV